MPGFGFGLERIGLLAIDRPLPFMAVLMAATFAAFFFIGSVSFNGSVTGVLPKTSENFLAYEGQKRAFRDFSREAENPLQARHERSRGRPGETINWTRRHLFNF